MPPRKSRETENALIDLYLQGKSAVMAGLELGVSGDTAYNILKRNGVEIRRDGMRKYHFNQRYFANITTPEQAHLLGMIATDGCIVDTALCLSLHQKDRSYLENVNSLLDSDVPIHDYTCNGKYPTSMSSMLLHSVAMRDDLARCGIHPRKTFSVQPWNGPADLMASYWHGCIDGDGSIYQGNQGSWLIGYCGNPSMVDGLIAFFLDRLGVKSNKVQTKGGVRIVTWSGVEKLQSILRLLHGGGSSLYLARKMAKAETLLAKPVRKKKTWLHVTREYLEEAYARLGCWRKVGTELGMSRPKNIRSLTRKFGFPPATS